MDRQVDGHLLDNCLKIKTWTFMEHNSAGSCLCVQCEVGEVTSFTVVRALARHRVLDISLGPQHSAVLVEPGHVYTVGSNSEAQLGCGSTRPYDAPISVKLFQQRHATVSVLCWWHLATI